MPRVDPWSEAAGLRLLVVVVSAFVLSSVLTPLVRNLALARGWVDHPDGRRKQHAVSMPRLGGLAVYVSFLLAFLGALPFLPDGGGLLVEQAPLLIAGAAVCAIGLADDLLGVSPAAKLVVQAAAGFCMWEAGYRITLLSNPLGAPLDLGAWSLPITLLWFVGMSNAFNLIDGLDGLAAGVGLFATTAVFVTAILNDRWDIAALSVALGGALLGFLRYNFTPASIFLGDCGSLFVGFALAGFAVRGSMKSSTAVAVAAPLMALALPILDTSIAVFRRFLSGRGVFEADDDHIHHRLLRKGLSPRRVVVTLYGVAALFAALSLVTTTGPGQVAGLVVLAFSVVSWIGVQQLGYAEFGEVQRILKRGLLYERRIVGNNLHLVDARRRLLEAPDLQALWGELVALVEKLGFTSTELVLYGGEDLSRRGAGVAAFPRWPDPPAPPGSPVWSWTVPLVHGGHPFGELRLTRPVGAEMHYEMSYLLVALTDGLANGLGRVLATAGSGAAEAAARGHDDSVMPDPRRA